MPTSIAFKFGSDTVPTGRQRLDIDATVRDRLREPDAFGSSGLTLPQSSPSAASQAANDEKPIEVFPPDEPPPRTRFLPLNEWEGVVERVDRSENTFWARIDDMTNAGVPQEFAEFYIEDVRDDDHMLLRPGAVFRWVIGKREDQFGTIERSSRLVFRRLPAYSMSDIAAADRRAERLAGGIHGR